MVERPRSLLRRLARFVVADEGVAAVEMALLTPVALGFLSVVVAGGQALNIYHKTVLSAHIVTDIVSRTPYSPDASIATAEQLAASALDADLALGQLVFYPNDATNLQIVMTEIKVNASNNTGAVVWSEGYNGATAVACNVVFTLDPAYAGSGATYLLFGQVSYNYQPLGGIFQLSPMTLSATETLTIRNAPQITVPGVQRQC